MLRIFQTTNEPAWKRDTRIKGLMTLRVCISLANPAADALHNEPGGDKTESVEISAVFYCPVLSSGTSQNYSQMTDLLTLLLRIC